MSLLSLRSSCAVMAALLSASLPTLAQRPVLTKHVPALVQQKTTTRNGAVAASRRLQVDISLPLRNQDALNSLLADLYNPASASYHQWLQPADFDARFGPTAADYASLLSWATSNGLDIVAQSANHHVLTVQGSTGLINRAFHVKLTSYHDASRNRDFQAPDREPTMDIAIPVFAVSGLDTSAPRVNHHRAATSADNLSPYISLRNTLATATPTSSLMAASGGAIEAGTVASGVVDSGVVAAAPSLHPEAVCSGTCTGSGASGNFFPSDIRAAYYGTGPLTGSGQNVAIFSYDGYLTTDIAKWYSTTGVAPSTVPVSNVLTGGFDGGCELSTPCDDGEQVLDILQVQGMAPGLSHIYFYEGLSAVTELNQMVSDNSAASISCSWGGGDFGAATEPIFMQMAAQGQSFLSATGDYGAYNGYSYLPPSSSPWVVQIGGTDLTTASAGGAWSSETAWTDSSGGFFDPYYTIPTWQQTPGIITSTNAGSTTLRNAPDFAAEANFDNTTVSNGSFVTSEGGTSYAAPRMTGYIALANQQSVANGTGRLGFINPALYEFGLSPNAAAYFHDITSGTNPSTFSSVTTTFSAVAGYDLVTGWGSPNGTGLLNALVGPNFTMSLSASAITVTRSTSNSVITITINPINGFSGTPTLSVTNLPSGITGAFSKTGTNTYSLTLIGDGTVVSSTSIATITATYGSFSQVGMVTVNGAKRAGYDFTISATNVVVQQVSSVNSIITVVPGSGTAAPVDLTVSNLPAGVSAQLGTPSTFSKSNLTFNVSLASAPGTYTVLVTGSMAGGIVHTTPVTLVITGISSSLPDGDFESTSNPWIYTTTAGGYGVCTSACGFYSHGGVGFAILDNIGAVNTDTLSQTFAVGGSSGATLNFWLWVGTLETSSTAKNDTLTVSVINASGASTTIATFSNLDHSTGYVLHSYDLSAFIGQTVTLKFTGVENRSKVTAFVLDDISVVTR